jgi:hypothetical protein
MRLSLDLGLGSIASLSAGVLALFDLRVNGQPLFVNSQQLKATGNGN